MSRINNTFNQGKMNKDLDERIIPNGQYRHAMNVQLATSDGSDTGVIQNLLGNEIVNGQSIASDSVCVGKVTDEKDNAIYYFVHESPIIDFTNIPTAGYYVIKDAIYRYKNNSVTPVFIDIHNKYLFPGPNGINPYTGSISLDQANFDAVEVGDIVKEFVEVAGTNILETITVGLPVLSKDPSNNTIILGDISELSTDGSGVDIVNYLNGQPFLMANVTPSKNKVLNFSTKIITGINILDDFLLFTDNVNEPKKINIPRSIQGTTNSSSQTKLVVNGAVTNKSVEEYHVTIIKKSPKYPPVLEMSDGRRFDPVYPDRKISGTLNIDFDGNEVGDSVTLDATTFTDYSAGDYYDFRVNDILVLRYYEDNVHLTPLTEWEVKLEVDTVTTAGTAFTTSIISISNSTPVGLDNATGLAPSFVIDLFEPIEKMFEFKFPRFAYRWVYEDKEYSTFSPFSEVAFLPGNFDYHPKKGYNIGMSNKLAQLYVKEFVAKDIPEDVVAIDILYKESNSANVYIVDTLRPDDPLIATSPYNGNHNAWTLPNMRNIVYNSRRKGKYEVKSETIYATLPSNQLLRVYDTVPRKALAQEVTGNRLVYGNYVQNYDLNNLSADFSVSLKTLGSEQKGEPGKSIKSIRDYQVGVIYLDEYGRQTPILSSNSGIKKISKAFADDYNRLSVQCKHDPPPFAKTFKFYIKDTANEFYNLALDRFYDAKDDNVWLSFASSDRNKVDIDTFLILKKGTESDNLVAEKARYKILAIENEAPDYIKRNQFDLGLEFHDNSNNDVFTQDPNKFPLQSKDTFSVRYDPFVNSSLDNIHLLLEQSKDKEEIQVQFQNTSTKQSTKKYRITNISATIDASTGNPQAGTQIDFTVDPAFESDVNFIYDSANNQIKSGTAVVLQKVQVENSPEFDGKFFVKILKDDIINKHLNPSTNADTQYRIIDSRKIYYRSPSFIFDHSDGVNSPAMVGDHGGTGYHENGVLADAFGYTSSDYYYGDNDLRSYWYKATAFARQRGTLKIGDRVDQSTTVAYGTYQDVWYINDWHLDFATPYIGDTSGSATLDNLNFSYINRDNPSSPGYSTSYRKRANGITSWTNTSRIELAFTGLEPSRFNQPSSSPSTSQLTGYASLNNFSNATAVGWNVPGNAGMHSTIFYVGDASVNPKYGDEATFVNGLDVGKQIRWSDDPTGSIYTITSVTRRYLLDHEHEKYAIFGGRRPENYVTSWVLYLDRPIAWDPTAPNNGAQAMNGYSPNTDPYAEFEEDGTTAVSPVPSTMWRGISKAQGYDLEIVEPIYDDLEMPKNPSIFETEPKENIDLDLYYEASQEYPVNLNTDNFQDVLKVFSTVSLPSYNTTSDLNNGAAAVFLGGITSENKLILTANYWATLDLSDSDVLIFEYENKNINIQIIGDYNLVDTPPGTVQTNSGVNLVNSVAISYKTNIHDSPISLDWYNCYSFANGVESNRVRDTFNAVTIDKGAVVSTTLDDENLYNEDRKTNGLIFSGIYNSIGGVNELNQFVQADKITKDINPSYGSVQKLFSRNTDLIAFCEDRVIKILANKDAVFNGDGNPQLTANTNVLGQTIPFVGDYGISQNPESFASESYRAYFTDKQRSAVLRLSMDGLTAISNDGMRDYFGEKLKDSAYLIGSYDANKEEYNLTVRYSNNFKIKTPNDTTVSYDEKVKGWVSFKSFVLENGCSIQNDYFTFNRGRIYKHHVEGVRANEFYGDVVESHVNLVFNQDPSMIKSFNAIMYEGSQGKVQRGSGYTDNNFYGYKSLYNKNGWYVEEISTEKSKGSVLNFLDKEDKWFGSIRGSSTGINDIDLKNFSVQGLGTIKDLEIEVAPYTITPSNISLTNFSNTLNTATIGYSFTPASTTGPFSIVNYRVFMSTGSQTPQQITNAVTGGLDHDPGIPYTITVSANDDVNDANNTHEFYVVAIDGNNQQEASSTETILALSIPAFTLAPLSLTVTKDTETEVEIDLFIPFAQGGTPPYTYTCTYQHSAMSNPADVLDPTSGSTFLLPNTTIPVDINPVPLGPQDITFIATATDSAGNTITSTSIVNAGVFPPLTGGVVANSGTNVIVVTTFKINGVADPNGNVINVLLLGNLGIGVVAGNGTPPYEAELGFSHGSVAPYNDLQYVDYASSTGSYPGGPDFDNLVINTYSQTPSLNVGCPSSTNIANTIVLDTAFNYSAPNPQVDIINVECLITDDNGNTLTANSTVDLVSINPSTFLGLYPYQ